MVPLERTDYGYELPVAKVGPGMLENGNWNGKRDLLAGVGVDPSKEWLGGGIEVVAPVE